MAAVAGYYQEEAQMEEQQGEEGMEVSIICGGGAGTGGHVVISGSRDNGSR